MWCSNCKCGSETAKFAPGAKCPMCGKKEFVMKSPLPQKSTHTLFNHNKGKKAAAAITATAEEVQ